MNERDLTGYCGLYCGDCIRYKCRASELASDLLKELENTEFSEYAEVKKHQIPDFEHYEQMTGLLDHISRLRCEVPCRLGGDGCAGGCTIVGCVKDKSLEGCWECAQCEKCEKLDFLKPIHGDKPVSEFEKIKKFGLGAWAKHRGRFYPWQKRIPPR